MGNRESVTRIVSFFMERNILIVFLFDNTQKLGKSNLHKYCVIVDLLFKTMKENCWHNHYKTKRLYEKSQ